MSYTIPMEDYYAKCDNPDCTCDPCECNTDNPCNCCQRTEENEI